ncbi:hypothetical protein C802_04292 [Phocaeicola sartorii]|uniref:Uncharacterized protein n=2 Tax=Phocaeicola sartorii TaxID=671267 RepID=R9I631_9BACT|nr:hypothetical protein C802_04292 [Phocaeicola sartorii]
MFYKFGLNYVIPVIRIMLSNNRLYPVTPKGEVYDILWRITCLIMTEILMPFTILFIIWARIDKPVSRPLIYWIIGIAIITAILFSIKLKREKVCELFIEEADKLTKEEHRQRKKALATTFLLYYMTLPVSVVLTAWLTDIL